MRLWLLRPLKRGDPNDDPYEWGPWSPWFDKTFGFVVRAENEQEARQIASHHSDRETTNAWLYADFSSCVELTDEEGPAGVILQDEHWA